MIKIDKDIPFRHHLKDKRSSITSPYGYHNECKEAMLRMEIGDSITVEQRADITVKHWIDHIIYRLKHDSGIDASFYKKVIKYIYPDEERDSRGRRRRGYKAVKIRIWRTE